MLTSIDRVLAGFWSHILTPLSKFTGKDNFWLARHFIWTGYLLWASVGLLRGIASAEFIMLPLELMVDAYWYFLLKRHVLVTIEQLQVFQASPDTFSFGLARKIVALAIMRVTFFLIVLMFIALTFNIIHLIIFFGHLMMIGGMYFATDFRPGGKSWAKRFVEKLASTRAKPALNPS